MGPEELKGQLTGGATKTREWLIIAVEMWEGYLQGLEGQFYQELVLTG